MRLHHFDSLERASRALRSGEVSSVQLTEWMLSRIGQHRQLNAFVSVCEELAVKQAREADAEMAAGQYRGALHGIPIAIKDLIDTKDIRTTYGSAFFADHRPEEDAFVVRKLREAGAVTLGKTGLHEFAYGMTGVNEWYGTVRNPWRTDHVAGGSSSGSAAAVAAGLCFAAIGTDTGCSIRQPAHCCGIVGFKPTFGLVSKRGVFPLCYTMDHVGPMTRTVKDAAITLGYMTGRDPLDPFSVSPRHSDDFVSHTCELNGLRIGVIRDPFFDGDNEVTRCTDASLSLLADHGAEIVEYPGDGLREIYKSCRLTFAESLEIHSERLAVSPDRFGTDVRGKLESASSISAADYVLAQRTRRELLQRMEGVLSDCDILAAPTSTIAAVPINAIPERYFAWAPRNTGFADFTGQPAISIPCGLTGAGLPAGLMLTGRLHADRYLLQQAAAIETVLDWNTTPPID